MCDQEPPL